MSDYLILIVNAIFGAVIVLQAMAIRRIILALRESQRLWPQAEKAAYDRGWQACLARAKEPPKIEDRERAAYQLGVEHATLALTQHDQRVRGLAGKNGKGGA